MAFLMNLFLVCSGGGRNHDSSGGGPENSSFFADILSKYND